MYLGNTIYMGILINKLLCCCVSHFATYNVVISVETLFFFLKKKRFYRPEIAVG